MNKEEFLEILKLSLEGEIPEFEIAKHITYYRDYINNQTELDQLGNPRLIAKSIIESYNASPNAYKQKTAYNKSGYEEADYNKKFNSNSSSNKNNQYYNEYNKKEQQNDNYEDNEFIEKEHYKGNYHQPFDTIPWYYKVLMSILLVLVLIVVIAIGGIVLNILFTVVLPIIFLLIIIKLVVNSVSRR